MCVLYAHLPVLLGKWFNFQLWRDCCLGGRPGHCQSQLRIPHRHGQVRNKKLYNNWIHHIMEMSNQPNKSREKRSQIILLQINRYLFINIVQLFHEKCLQNITKFPLNLNLFYFFHTTTVIHRLWNINNNDFKLFGSVSQYVTK